MPFRVPFTICLQRLSVALHRRRASQERRAATFKLIRARNPRHRLQPARPADRRRLSEEPGDRAAGYRNVLVALWAARRLGMGAAETLRYARTLHMADREEPGYGDVVRRLMSDFRQAGLTVGEHEVEQQLLATQSTVLRRLPAPARGSRA